MCVDVDFHGNTMFDVWRWRLVFGVALRLFGVGFWRLVFVVAIVWRLKLNT